MSKHTPGPWKLRETPDDSDFIAEIDGIAAVYVVRNEAAANASLIAASPDLFDALEDCLEALRRAGAEGELRIAKAALAKARG